MLTVDRDAQSVILPLRIVNDAGVGVVGLAHDTAGLSIDYKVPSASNWVAVALSAGTVGTWSSGGFIAEPDGDGLYQLGLPNAAIAAGKSTRLRIKTSGNGYRYGFVAAVALGNVSSAGEITNEGVADEVVRRLGPIPRAVVSTFNAATGKLKLQQFQDYSENSASRPIEIPIANVSQFEVDDAVKLVMALEHKDAESIDGSIALTSDGLVARFEDYRPAVFGSGKYQVWHIDDTGKNTEAAEGTFSIDRSIENPGSA